MLARTLGARLAPRLGGRARAGPNAAEISTLLAVGYYPLAARASARPLRGSPRVSASTERRALTRTPPRSPLDSSTRAVKALGSKSVAGLPVMARCVRAPIPPHV